MEMFLLLKDVRNEGVYSVVNSRHRTLPLGKPVQVVRAHVYVTSQSPTIVKEYGIVALSSSCRDVGVVRIVLGITDSHAVVRRPLESELEPAPLALDLAGGGRVHSLSNSAAEVAQVGPCPQFQLHIPSGTEPTSIVHTIAVAGEVVDGRHRLCRSFPGVVRPKSERALTHPPRQPALNVRQAAVFAVSHEVSVQ